MQLPVYSPVSLRSLAAGIAALPGGTQARAGVRALLEAEYHPARMVLTDSGTSALTLALLAARADAEARGREVRVAIPAYGCFDLATAAVGAGVPIVPYDLDPLTLGPSWPALSDALESGATVIVVAHWYGVPADVGRVTRMAAPTGALVIDDAAQGLGAAVAGHPAGSLGDLGVLSFGRGKGRTGGGGGALLGMTERGSVLLGQVEARIATAESGIKRAVALSAQWLLGRPSLYWLPASLPFLRLGDTPYHDPGPMHGMPAFCAGALQAQWAGSADEILVRQRCAAGWRERWPDWTYPESDAPQALRGELRLPVIAADEAQRKNVVVAVPGAMPGYPRMLPELPALRKLLVRHQGTWPGAQVLVSRLVTLPCHRFQLARQSSA